MSTKHPKSQRDDRNARQIIPNAKSRCVRHTCRRSATLWFENTSNLGLASQAVTCHRFAIAPICSSVAKQRQPIASDPNPRSQRPKTRKVATRRQERPTNYSECHDPLCKTHLPSFRDSVISKYQLPGTCVPGFRIPSLRDSCHLIALGTRVTRMDSGTRRNGLK